MTLKTPVKEISEKLGVSTQAVYLWKAGKSLPSSKNLLKLAEMEGTTVDSLLNS
ncbi:MAG: helix-turn-helix domain-containing protein [Patescibacteria group bacterium]